MSKNFIKKSILFIFILRLGDVKDSCQIDYNGLFIEFNVKQLKFLNKLGEGSFGQVNLVQLENNPNVIFACKVSSNFHFIFSFFISK